MDGAVTDSLGLPKLPAIGLEAVSAIRTSLPGKLLGRMSALLALLVVFLGQTKAADALLAQLDVVIEPPWLHKLVLLGGPALVVAIQLANELRALRTRRAAQALAIKPDSVPHGYFRIGPYGDSKEDRKSFRRADRVHETVRTWLLAAQAVPLYLTGDSGSGKSSLLTAAVLPALRDAGWTVVTARAGQDPEAALTAALTPLPGADSAPVESLRARIETALRHAGGPVLLVLDQFEEFIILGTAERHQAFAALLADLAARQIKGLSVLLVLRSDYQPALAEIGLPRLRDGENWQQVPRFALRDARAFMAASKLDLKDDALDRLLASAAELDDTPGMVRPVTLNVIGYILRADGAKVAPSVDAGLLVRGYIARTVDHPAIRAWAPPILEELLTEQATKRPRGEAELVQATRLRLGEVRAVLNHLSAAALARPLDAAQAVWELSHDFVARAVSHHLGRFRHNLLRRAASYAAPILLALLLLVAAGATMTQRLDRSEIRNRLADLGLGVAELPDGSKKIESTSRLSAESFANTGGLLAQVTRATELDLSGTKVTSLEPLKGLTALQTLDLWSTQVTSLEPLKGLTALQTLNLEDTQVTSLEPLKGLTALQTLDLSGTKVASLEPLKGLTALQTLYLRNTQVTSLEPLKGLTALQTLDLRSTQVTSLEPLKGLTALQTLYLEDTQVTSLEPLKGLTALQTLNLEGTQVTSLEPLKGLTALQTLYLRNTQVTSLEPLKGLTALQTLDLSGTKVTSLEPLKGLTALQTLNLQGTKVASLEPLKGLTALQTLYLWNTQVTSLEPLQGLPNLNKVEGVSRTDLKALNVYRRGHNLPQVE